MKQPAFIFSLVFLMACNDGEKKQTATPGKDKISSKETVAISGGHFTGIARTADGEASISFDISDDGQEVVAFTYEGPWTCRGEKDNTTTGPEKNFTIKNGKVDGVITEPADAPDAYRYEVHANFRGNKATGTLRFSNAKDSCDTGMIEWSADKR